MLRRRPAPTITRMQAVIFGLVLAVASVFLVVPLIPAGEGIEEGENAPRTLTAARNAQYESRVLTEEKRNAAAAAVVPTRLAPDPAIRTRQLRTLDQFLLEVAAIRQKPNTTKQEQLTAVEGLASAATISADGRTAIIALDGAQFDAYRTRVTQALGEIMQGEVAINLPGDRDAIVDQLLARSTFWGVTSIDEVDLLRPPVRETLRAFVVQNAAVDERATEAARTEARQAVPTEVVSLSRGQVIATEGEELDAADIEALRETGALSIGFDYYKLAGGILFAVGFGALVGIYLYQVQPFHAPASRRLLLIGVVTIAALASARIALPELTPDRDGHFFAFALPLAAAAIVTASFADLPFAAVVAVAVGLFAAFIGAAAPELSGSGFIGSLESLELGIAYTAGGLAGAVAVHRAERLSRYLAAAVAVALATGLVLAAFWLIAEPRENEELAWQALAAGANGVASAVIGVGVFVVFSMLFGVTTRLQLMELAHSGHPLLRRLQDEAPGTYHHSMMVGALAERAADSIGADALVVRVGAYYHDIGKLAQPPYYIENQLDGSPSPHDALPPDQSARIIREHITNGLDIAARYRLPSIVREFIPQHHGTRLVTFFYRQATARGLEPDPRDYRYTGPRPQSKETAIVMLADSCEAIVRAHQDAGRAAIDELVDNIFAERLAEGQLDECDMTMRELQGVAASFKATLKAIYHPRIPYPTATPEELERIARGPVPESSERAGA
ncbi:MAG: HDIG domain-containing protein [Dehalococcoidia bacterium]|nr:HDIG domain-containing protein [Dehalococcoidia bacterium]